jgi:hypothetical protein
MVTFLFGHVWAHLGTNWHELARLGTNGHVSERVGRENNNLSVA